MIRKLFVIAMLIATFGIGNVTYAQPKWNKNHPRQRRRHIKHNNIGLWGAGERHRTHRVHRRHRRGGMIEPRSGRQS